MFKYMYNFIIGINLTLINDNNYYTYIHIILKSNVKVFNKNVDMVQ